MFSLLALHRLVWPLSSYNLLKGEKDEGAVDSPEGLKELALMTACWNPPGPPPAGKAKNKPVAK